MLEAKFDTKLSNFENIDSASVETNPNAASCTKTSKADKTNCTIEIANVVKKIKPVVLKPLYTLLIAPRCTLQRHPIEVSSLCYLGL